MSVLNSIGNSFLKTTCGGLLLCHSSCLHASERSVTIPLLLACSIISGFFFFVSSFIVVFYFSRLRHRTPTPPPPPPPENRPNQTERIRYSRRFCLLNGLISAATRTVITWSNILRRGYHPPARDLSPATSRLIERIGGRRFLARRHVIAHNTDLFVRWYWVPGGGTRRFLILLWLLLLLASLIPIPFRRYDSIARACRKHSKRLPRLFRENRFFFFFINRIGTTLKTTRVLHENAFISLWSLCSVWSSRVLRVLFFTP